MMELVGLMIAILLGLLFLSIVIPTVGLYIYYEEYRTKKRLQWMLNIMVTINILIFILSIITLMLSDVMNQ